MQYTIQHYSPGTRELSIATSVVIVGAGPTGLVAANLLGMAGIKTLLLERNADLSDCPKAISIDDEGLRICQTIGLADEILKHVALGIDAHYLSMRHFLAKVSPTSIRNGYPLISTFHQPTLETTLLKGLERFQCVETRFQHTVETFTQDDEKVTLTFSTPEGVHSTITCTYLLACDGGKSPIRHLLGIAMQKTKLFVRRPRRNTHEVDQGQRWLVVDTINDDDTSLAATFFCDYRRPAVSVPAPHNARRWEFMLLHGENEKDLLDDQTIHKLIQQARVIHPSIRMKIQQHKPIIVRKTIYAFRSVIAQKFMHGRVFLLGDAAHLMPPFGGQGMNSGLRDAHNLCWKIQHVIQGQATPELLTTYHEERYPHVREMILFSSILGNLVMTTTRQTAQLRDWFFAIVNNIPYFRDAISEMRVKPQPRYRHRLFLPHKYAKLIGTFLPQPNVLTLQGTKVRLDEVLGHGFAALRLYENPETAFEGIQGSIWHQLQVKKVCVLPQGREKSVIAHDTCEVVCDVDGQLEGFLQHRRDIVVLVRPDRYVGGVYSL